MLDSKRWSARTCPVQVVEIKIIGHCFAKQSLPVMSRSRPFCDEDRLCFDMQVIKSEFEALPCVPFHV